MTARYTSTVATYTYQDAVDHCTRLTKGIPVSTMSVVAVDQVAAKFWKAYPWPWSRHALVSIPLSDGVQDYALDATDLSKVWRLLNGRITRTTSTPDEYRDVRIMRHQEPYLYQKISWPNFQLASFEPEIDKIRLEAAVYNPSGQALQFDGEYQCFSPKVTSLASTIHFPDHNLDVFVEGLLWMLYRLADDKRAGTAIKTPVGVQYTGQLGIFYDALVMTKEAEEHGAGDTIYPEISIGGESLTSSNFGIF